LSDDLAPAVKSVERGFAGGTPPAFVERETVLLRAIEDEGFAGGTPPAFVERQE
jgi:hypothetical protein